jgi:hypothetical protein
MLFFKMAIQAMIPLLLIGAVAQAFSPNSMLLKKGFFSPTAATSTKRFMSTSDVEALLAKARALRQQAEAEENVLHSTLLEKKQCQNQDTDRKIDLLFPLTDNAEDKNDIVALAKRLDESKLSTECLKRIVERLHDREMSAKGVERVDASHHNEGVKFNRVSEKNTIELERVQGLILNLIAAADILDEQHLKMDAKHHGVDKTHWARGELGKVLKEKAHFLGREHDEEFKNRLQEFYEAAKKKKNFDGYKML